jgi:alkanesulfonate monooxygenase SsuD/methylene tetrahydromethanopterin reductase-like flavin-dependent oxidoreductase (luciferase family)
LIQLATLAPPKFGIQFRNFPRKFRGEIVDQMLDVAKNCERLGFDSIWMIDHLEMKPPISYESQPIPECWTILSSLAVTTTHMQIGSLVSCALFRNPSYLGKICATISEICSNRLIVGLGSGWFEGEFSSYGLSYPSTRERISITANTADLIRRSIPKVRLPIWIGGSGENLTLKMVARFADGSSMFGDPATVRRKISVLQDHCKKQRRDFSSIVKSKHSNVIVAESEEQVEQQLSQIVPDRSKWKNFSENNIVGDPQKCREQILRYVDAGVEYFTLSFPDLFDLTCLDIFSKSVMSEIKSTVGQNKIA